MSSMRITDGKGVHFTFYNGITISIQIGGGNYGDNYNEPTVRMGQGEGYVLPSSTRAEIAVWSNDGKMIDISGDIVKGYVPVEEVMRFSEFLRSMPSDLEKSELEIAVAPFNWIEG